MIIDDKNKIKELIPQKPPFVMIDKLIDTNEESTISGFKITKDNIFVDDDNIFNESGIIENIAQTAAVRIGYDCYINNKPVPLGFIGAVKNFNLYDLPKLDQELKTKITMGTQVLNVGIITGEVFVDNNKIADCEMKIVIQE